MNEVLAMVNENWAKLLKVFKIRIIETKEEILNFRDKILLVSEDKKPELQNILDELEEKNIIIGEIPANQFSEFDVEDIKRLMAKVVGFYL